LAQSLWLPTLPCLLATPSLSSFWMSAVVATVFHWVGFLTAVPLALGFLFTSNPEKVKVSENNLAIPVPRAFVGFCSNFAHLTVVAHETTTAYFLYALLVDHGFLTAPATDEPQLRLAEVCYAVICAVALFVTTVFWGSVIVNPRLMAPVDMLLAQVPPEKHNAVLFQMFFLPPKNTPMHGFCIFMRYVHTFCPMLLLLDMACTPHVPCPWSWEVAALLVYGFSYLGWNFFCWWLLRVPPYPLQYRIWQQGSARAVTAYAVLLLHAVLLLVYARCLRWGCVSAVGKLVLNAPLVGVIWASFGLKGMTQQLARYQGVDMKTL